MKRSPSSRLRIKLVDEADEERKNEKEEVRERVRIIGVLTKVVSLETEV